MINPQRPKGVKAKIDTIKDAIPITNMRISYDSIGHESPYGLLTVVDSKKFSWKDGEKFLTRENITDLVNYWNPRMARHWYIPQPTGKVLPVRKHNPNPCFIKKSVCYKPYWTCGYRFEVEWSTESTQLQEYGGIDISKNFPRKKLNLDMMEDEEIY